MRNPFILVFILFTVGCGYHKDPIEEQSLSADNCVHEKFFSADGSILGYRPGMTLAELEEKRQGFNLFESGNEVVDSVPFCGDDSSFAEVSFLLSNGRVADIQVLFILGSYELIDQVEPVIREKLTEKYGVPTSEQDIFSWEEYSGNKVVQIEFSDASVYYGKPVLKLIFFTAGNVAV